MTPELQDIQVREALHESIEWVSSGNREYRLPFKLSGMPSEEWVRTFKELCLLRRGATVHADQLTLILYEADDEAQYVMELKRVVDATNKAYREKLQEREEAKHAAEEHQRQRGEKIEEIRERVKKRKF